jgi:hypothetical protein
MRVVSTLPTAGTLTAVLLWGGLTLFALGAAGDLAYHALPLHVAAALDPLVGPEAVRAHLLALLGMLAVVASLAWKGVRHAAQR